MIIEKPDDKDIIQEAIDESFNISEGSNSAESQSKLSEPSIISYHQQGADKKIGSMDYDKKTSLTSYKQKTNSSLALSERSKLMDYDDSG